MVATLTRPVVELPFKKTSDHGTAPVCNTQNISDDGPPCVTSDQSKITSAECIREDRLSANSAETGSQIIPVASEQLRIFPEKTVGVDRLFGKRLDLDYSKSSDRKSLKQEYPEDHTTSAIQPQLILHNIRAANNGDGASPGKHSQPVHSTTDHIRLPQNQQSIEGVRKGHEVIPSPQPLPEGNCNYTDTVSQPRSQSIEGVQKESKLASNLHRSFEQLVST
ncbi:hypothetical protein MMC13_007763 [Lambiella insularis]|nr:hypothetical protein [Lambiella insularis]